VDLLFIFSQKYSASTYEYQSAWFNDALRLKHFLKIASVTALAAIVIDTALAGQKVRNAHDMAA